MSRDVRKTVIALAAHVGGAIGAMRRIRSTWIAMALIAVAVVGIAGAATTTAATQAAWSDRAHTSAAVSAGTWATTTANSCKAMNAAGKELPNGTCKVTSVTFSQWADGKNTVRDYYISFEMSNNAAFPQFTVDLSKGTGSGTFSWATAGTIATNQYTPLSGYKCSELPTLRANGPSNWGSAYQIWVRVVQEPTGQGATRNCS
jgi:hypothetical protein